MNEPMILLLRTVHILAGLFWVGATLTVGLFVFPGAMAAGPSGMQVVQQIMLRRKLVVYLPVSAVLTMLAGIALYWRAMSVSGGAWRLSPMGTGMTVGAGAAILAAIMGMGVASPAGGSWRPSDRRDPAPTRRNGPGLADALPWDRERR